MFKYISILLFSINVKAFECGKYQINGYVKEWQKGQIAVVVNEKTKSEIAIYPNKELEPKLISYENQAVTINGVLTKFKGVSSAQLISVDEISLRVDNPLKGSENTFIKLISKGGCKK